MEVNNFERGLVVHFADQTMNHCFYGFLRSLGIQYTDGRSQSSSLVEKLPEDRTDALLWSSTIRSFDWRV